jgi:hypothetical protein
MRRDPTYFFTVLRSSPKLEAIWLCERPACQWIKISVTSTTSNVLLANLGSHQLIRWDQPLPCEDHTNDDTLAFPVGNYVNAALGNYVNENLVKLGNYLNADTSRREPMFLYSAIARPGNSGGPIVAADGRVIGLVVEDSLFTGSAKAADSEKTRPRWSWERMSDLGRRVTDLEEKTRAPAFTAVSRRVR